MIGGPGNIRLASAISGSGNSIAYTGSGTLTLAAVGTYSGGTTVNAGGTLQVTAGSTTNSGAGSGPISLDGNAVLELSMTNTMMNNVISGGSTSTIDINMGAGNLWLSNSTASQLNGFNGTLNVNTTATNGGQLVIGTGAAIMTINASTIWQIQTGAVVDFNVNQTDPGSVYLYGAPYTGASDGSLRLDDSVQSGPVVLLGNSQIGNGSAAGPSTITGTISDNGDGFGFAKTGANPIVLTAANTYSGNTSINAGTLSLTGTGSINNSSNISIAAGATFDVSGLASATYTLSGSTSLSATGTAGASTATINGASSGTVSLASQPVLLNYNPASTNGDTAHPALSIAQAALQLNNNTITVNNASAQPLGVGTYTVIQDAIGSISGTPNATVNVTGSGLAAGTAGSLSVSGGNVNLVVVSAVVPIPKINSFVKSGGNLILSGTNGPANGTYTVLSSTNAALHLNLWTPISTNTFSPTGAFSVTNAITGKQDFFIIQVP
jgi:autotransporter-associated beta strand protein